MALCRQMWMTPLYHRRRCNVGMLASCVIIAPFYVAYKLSASHWCYLLSYSWQVLSNVLTRTSATHPCAAGTEAHVRGGDDETHWARTIWAIHWWCDATVMRASSIILLLTDVDDWLLFPPRWVALLLMSISEALFVFRLQFYVAPLFCGTGHAGNKSLDLNSAT